MISSCHRTFFTSGFGLCRPLCTAKTRYSDAVEHVEALRGLIGADHVQNEGIDKYTRDWTGHYSGGNVVAFPSCAEQVSSLLKYCHARRVGVVIQGGNTGLVGGAVGTDKELIISSSRMNDIYHLDETTGVLTCGAGVILADASCYVSERRFMMPVDLGSKASCMLGGNISSNAGGLKVVKYGSLHANVVGLEVVLADGTVLDMLRVVQKDNCGYPLKHLFIGSEGTLGVITKVAIKLHPLPTSTCVAVLKLRRFQDIWRLLKSAKTQLGESLSAFEYMDRKSIAAVSDQYPHKLKRLKDSLLTKEADRPEAGGDKEESETYVLIEVSSCNKIKDSQSSLANQMNFFLSSELEKEVAENAVIAQDKQQEEDMWSMRELIPVALASMTRNSMVSGPFLLKYDISVPWQETEGVIATIERELSECGHVVLDQSPIYKNSSVSSRAYLRDHAEVSSVVCFYCYGHAGDQNLHLNVTLHLQDGLTIENQVKIKQSVQRDLERAVLGEVNKHRGSFSAEHGVGQQKSHLLEEARTGAEVMAMKALKQTFDPTGILNPGKVIPLPCMPHI